MTGISESKSMSSCSTTGGAVLRAVDVVVVVPATTAVSVSCVNVVLAEAELGLEVLLALASTVDGAGLPGRLLTSDVGGWSKRVLV